MFDDFFMRALIAGIGIAIVTGPLGCLVIWRSLSYFGDTLSHSALLGVTLAYAFSINISLSVFIISGTVALLLLSLQKRTKLAGDSLLGLLAHSTLAIGLVFIGFLSSIKPTINIMADANTTIAKSLDTKFSKKIYSKISIIKNVQNQTPPFNGIMFECNFFTRSGLSRMFKKYEILNLK